MSFGSRLTWYRHRLQAMSFGEVWHRLVEKWHICTEGGFLEGLSALEHHEVNAKVPRLPSRESFSAEAKALLSQDAARLLRGDWQIFGWKDVSVGAPPCWHRDPACGVVIDPDTPAHRLDHRHLPDGADARTIWEINRWAEMTRLAMHGWINGDLDAARTAQLWLEDWCERNPPGLGINWTSPLEAALRLLNFTWFDALISATVKEHPGKCQLITTAQAALVQRIVPVHAAWVWRYQSKGSSANNHLLGELVALVVSASRWPALEKLTSPVEHTWTRVSREVLRQFAADGGSCEQALHYHLFAFDLAWQAVRAVGCRAGDAYDRLCAAGHFFVDLTQDAEVWDFGDNDDAQVLPFADRRSQAVKEWRAWLAGTEGSLRGWLGETPLMQPRERDLSTPWRVFPVSGLAALRSQGWFLRLDASPLGFGKLAAHGHCDALHLSVWDGESALLIDPGTGGYYGQVPLRTELASWYAHNGPQPDVVGFKTPLRVGPFLQTQHHAAPALLVESSTAAARFEHEGHAFQRQVHFHGDTLEIRDSEDHSLPFMLQWYVAPSLTVFETAPGHFRLSLGQSVWSFEMEAPDATWTVSRRRVSPAYGGIAETTVITVSGIRKGIMTRLRRQPN